MNIDKALEDYAIANITSTNSWYSWRRINVARLPAGVCLARGSQYLQNEQLKLDLHRLWSVAAPAQKLDIATYYVKVWGGVKGNDPATLRGYANASAADLIANGVSGIASWSKILCVMRPETYPIYDARVAVALNSLQVTSKVRSPYLFPLLASQNATIKAGNVCIKSHAKSEKWGSVPAKTAYLAYILLLHSIAKRLSVPVYTIEMLLFSKAPDLLKSAFPAGKF